MYDSNLFKNINDLQTKIKAAETGGQGRAKSRPSTEPNEAEKKAARSKATQKKAEQDSYRSANWTN